MSSLLPQDVILIATQQLDQIIWNLLRLWEWLRAVQNEPRMEKNEQELT